MATRRIILGATLAAPALRTARAQDTDWPTRPVVLVVPTAAGGSGDTLARLLAEALRPRLAQPVVVENRTGVGGLLGAEYVAKSPVEANRFLLAAVHHAIFPAVQARMPYDSLGDFAPVADISSAYNALIINPALPVRSVAELVAYAKAHPGRLNFATAGRGTLHHVTASLFIKLAGIDAAAVHYRGSAPAMNDLVAGNVQAMFETMPSAAGQIRGGQVRALAVTALERVALLPDVPTMGEAGYPDVIADTWYGIFAVRGTPPAVLERMNAAIAASLATPEMRAAWERNGVTGGGKSVEAFTRMWEGEVARWKELAARAGVEPE